MSSVTLVHASSPEATKLWLELGACNGQGLGSRSVGIVVKKLGWSILRLSMYASTGASMAIANADFSMQFSDIHAQAVEKFGSVQELECGDWSAHIGQDTLAFRMAIAP